MAEEEDILSQEEIDALLTGVDEGDIETNDSNDAEDSTAYVEYDLTSQDKVVRGRLPTLDVINERLSKHLRAALFAMLRRSIEVEFQGVQIQKFSEYQESLTNPSYLTLLNVSPLRGDAVIAMEQGLVFKLVDNYFGGEGHEPKLEERDFTPSETRVVDMFLEHALIGLKDAWEKVMPINISITGREVNPAMIALAGPGDAIIVNAFKFEFDGLSGEFHFSLPYSMIDPVKELLISTSKSSQDVAEAGWSESLRRDILRANVELGCTLTEREISLRDIVNLKTGDVIPVDMPKNMTLEANGAPIYKVKLGRSRGNLALEIVGRTSIEQIGMSD